MQLTVSVKQPGRKHAVIDKKIIDIEDIGSRPTAAALLTAVVHHQVREYNAKPKEKNLLPFLSNTDTEEQISKGKVSFGSIYNENKADAEIATATALQSFEDGMFALFVNDEEVKSLHQNISITGNIVVTFIRLTFLAGSYW